MSTAIGERRGDELRGLVRAYPVTAGWSLTARMGKTSVSASNRSRQGSGARADDGDRVAAEVFFPLLAGGAPVGAPTRVGTVREARELALTADPRGGSWAAWSVHAARSVVMVRRVGPDGAPVGPELSVPGELLALRGQAVGFTLVSSGEPEGPCIVARAHDDLGRSGPAVALVPGDDCGLGGLGTAPTWRPDNADIAWGPGPTAAVFVGQGLPGDPFVRFARTGGPVRMRRAPERASPARRPLAGR